MVFEKITFIVKRRNAIWQSPNWNFSIRKPCPGKKSRERRQYEDSSRDPKPGLYPHDLQPADLTTAFVLRSPRKTPFHDIRKKSYLSGESGYALSQTFAQLLRLSPAADAPWPFSIQRLHQRRNRYRTAAEETELDFSIRNTALEKIEARRPVSEILSRTRTGLYRLIYSSRI